LGFPAGFFPPPGGLLNGMKATGADETGGSVTGDFDGDAVTGDSVVGALEGHSLFQTACSLQYDVSPAPQNPNFDLQ